MLCSANHIGTLWVVAALVIPQSVETIFVRGCTQIQESMRYASNIPVGCESGQIIHIIRVSLWRANPDATCRHIDLRNVSLYTCEMISNAVRQRCHQQNSCRYLFTYPDVNDCPGQTYLPDRPIVMRIDWACVRPLTMALDNDDDETTSAVLTTMSDNGDSEKDDIRHEMAATATHTDRERTGVVIGVAVGVGLVIILSTIIVAVAIVFVIRRRSQAKSTSPGEPVTMGTNIGSVTAQPNIYEYS